MKQRTVHIFIGSTLVVFGFFLFSVAFAEFHSPQQTIISRVILPDLFNAFKPLQPARPTFRIGWAGDLVPGDHLENPTEHAEILSNVDHIISMPDLMVANLEGVLTSETSNSKCEFDPVMCFAFRGEPEDAQIYASHGIDAMTVANNHTNDYGDIGRSDTVGALSDHDIVAVGASSEISYFIKDDVQVALLAFSPHRNSSDMNNDQFVSALVAEANSNADIVIVFFHGGAEGINKTSTPTDTEFYLNEDRGNVREFAYFAIDSGADLVLGAGPHVLRGMELYKEKLIAYSLGNFAGYGSLKTTSNLGISGILDLTFDAENHNLVAGRIHPLQLNGKGIPFFDEQMKAVELMNTVSKNDFGENAVLLDSSGAFLLDRSTTSASHN